MSGDGWRFSSDGRFLKTRRHLWDLQERQALPLPPATAPATAPIAANARLASRIVSPQGQFEAFVSANKRRVEVREVLSGRRVGVINLPFAAEQVVFCGENGPRVLFQGRIDGALRLWDVATGKARFLTSSKRRVELFVPDSQGREVLVLTVARRRVGRAPCVVSQVQKVSLERVNTKTRRTRFLQQVGKLPRLNNLYFSDLTLEAGNQVFIGQVAAPSSLSTRQGFLAGSLATGQFKVVLLPDHNYEILHITPDKRFMLWQSDTWPQIERVQARERTGERYGGYDFPDDAVDYELHWTKLDHFETWATARNSNNASVLGAFSPDGRLFAAPSHWARGNGMSVYRVPHAKQKENWGATAYVGGGIFVKNKQCLFAPGSQSFLVGLSEDGPDFSVYRLKAAATGRTLNEMLLRPTQDACFSSDGARLAISGWGWRGAPGAWKEIGKNTIQILDARTGKRLWVMDEDARTMTAETKTPS